MSKLVDLHLHTTASDGTMTPSELVKYAKSKRLIAIAITDHDNVDGIEEALAEGKRLGIEVIPGIEMNFDYYGQELHMLGININYKHKPLLDKIDYLKKERENRNIKAINKLNEVFCTSITLSDLVDVASGGVIAKSHIIKVIMSNGITNSYDEARALISEGGIAYFSKAKLTGAEAIKLIKDAKGIPILAHPGYLDKNEIEKTILDLKNDGLEGIEVYHSDHDAEMTKFLLDLSKQHKLCISGGSDFHGANMPWIDMCSGRDNIAVEYEILNELKKDME